MTEHEKRSRDAELVKRVRLVLKTIRDYGWLEPEQAEAAARDIGVDLDGEGTNLPPLREYEVTGEMTLASRMDVDGAEKHRPGDAMTMNAYQQEALRTAQVDESNRLEPLGLARDALGVAGEAGEVADLFKKVIGHNHPLDFDKAKKELGDTLWYIAVVAHRLGFSLADVARANIEKLRARYPSGFSSERSINRADES
jgi:NTP pyrophosphatase (non-canonical NTP hydrolase)